MTTRVLAEVLKERIRQDDKWGQQNHPDGTGAHSYVLMADVYRAACDRKHAAGEGTWADILAEEFYEALAVSDTEELRAELVQLAAVAVSWVEAIDRRS